jgi:phosphatidylglycerol:prolipoprotein diacylglycerol transferase
MSFDPYGIHLGPLYFRYYGMILVLGAFAATYLGRRLAEKMGIKDPDFAWDALIWALVFGVIGARIYHVLTPSKELIEVGITTKWYFENPINIINLTRGGLGIPGGIAGGALGLYIFARRNNLDILLILDAASPGVALAQVIGRWGNFVNQELYGPPTDLPWKIFIKPENRISPYQAEEYFHPLFLYESLWSLLNMFFLLWLWRRHGDKLLRGDLFMVYLITYPIGRFLLEFIRLDYVPMFGVNFNQAMMAVVAIASAAVIFIRHRRAREG